MPLFNRSSFCIRWIFVLWIQTPQLTDTSSDTHKIHRLVDLSENGWSNDKPWRRFSLDLSVFPSTSDLQGSWVRFPLWTALAWDMVAWPASIGHDWTIPSIYSQLMSVGLTADWFTSPVALPAMPPSPLLDFHSRYVAVDVLDMSRQMNWARKPRGVSFSRWVPSTEHRIALIFAETFVACWRSAQNQEDSSPLVLSHAANPGLADVQALPQLLQEAPHPSWERCITSIIVHAPWEFTWDGFGWLYMIMVEVPWWCLHSVVWRCRDGTHISRRSERPTCVVVNALRECSWAGFGWLYMIMVEVPWWCLYSVVWRCRDGTHISRRSERPTCVVVNALRECT